MLRASGYVSLWWDLKKHLSFLPPTRQRESLGFSVLSVLLCLFLLGRWGAGTRYGMRRDAPSLPAYKTEAPLTFFCGARSAVLSSTDISTYTCIRIQRNACTRILAWLSRCPNLNNAIGLPWVFSASLFHLRTDHAMSMASWCLAFDIRAGSTRIIFIWPRKDASISVTGTDRYRCFDICYSTSCFKATP